MRAHRTWVEDVSPTGATKLNDQFTPANRLPELGSVTVRLRIRPGAFSHGRAPPLRQNSGRLPFRCTERSARSGPDALHIRREAGESPR